MATQLTTLAATLLAPKHLLGRGVAGHGDSLFILPNLGAASTGHQLHLLTPMEQQLEST